MDIIFGMACKDFAVVVSDMTAARSIMTFKHDEDKITQIDEKKLLACAGEQSNRVQFSEYITRNLALTKLRTGLELSNHATANFIRKQVADALRTRGAYQTNSLLASVSEEEGPELYYLDYFGSLQKVPFTAHGYGSYFSLSLLDAQYKPDLTVEEGIKIVKACADQLNKRFLINIPKYMIKVIPVDGEIFEDVYIPEFAEFDKN